jgi:hypothetical protein
MAIIAAAWVQMRILFGPFGSESRVEMRCERQYATRSWSWGMLSPFVLGTMMGGSDEAVRLVKWVCRTEREAGEGWSKRARP